MAFMWNLAVNSFGHKSRVFKPKNNGHQNFTLSLGIPDPPFFQEIFLRITNFLSASHSIVCHLLLFFLVRNELIGLEANKIWSSTGIHFFKDIHSEQLREIC